jgi:hypothetical protein
MYLMERLLQAGRQITVHRSTAIAAMEREEMRMKTAWTWRHASCTKQNIAQYNILQCY